MSIALEYSSLDSDTLKYIRKRGTLQPDKNQYQESVSPVEFFLENRTEDAVYIPFGMWEDLLEEFPSRKYQKSSGKCLKTLFTPETDPDKRGRDQTAVFEEARKCLEKHHSVFLALHTGFGKTTLGNYFSGYFGLKTLILCHLDGVNRQWVNEFEKFSTCKVQRVAREMDPEADVYIMGVQKASHYSRRDFRQRGIGLVILDEAHIATITAFSNSLLKIQPRYLIALSATPGRQDGMDRIFPLFFGDPSRMIVRREVKPFTVYKVETPFKPEVRYVMRQGRMAPDWNHIINSISENVERHKLIADLVTKHSDERFLILSGRQTQSIGIHKILEERGEDTHLYIKNAKRKECRVLVAEMKKAGVGFDDPSLTALVIATDCSQVQQYEGRVRKNNNIIFHLVDDYRTFEKHWEICQEWYLQRGATIKTLSFRKTPTKKDELPRLIGPR